MELRTIGLAADRTVLIAEAALRLGVSRRTVYYRIQAGELKTIRTRCGSQRVLCSSIAMLLEGEEGRRDRRRRRVVSHAESLALQVEALA